MPVHDVIAAAGKWSVTLLEVGSARHPGEWIGPEHPEWFWSPMNVVLLRSGDETVLIDAGPGITDSWWPFEGIHADTMGPLASAGVEPDGVDTIVLTHLDYDHAGGLLVGTWPDELGLAFPRAKVVVHEDAVAFARAADPDAEANVGTRLIDLLEREGRLVVVSDGDKVADGIRVRSAPGHRAGHMIVEVGGPDPFTHVADTFHHADHAVHPEWDSSADEDPALALETRRRVLAELADAGTRIVVTHIPGPHAFRVVREGDSFRLTPVQH